MHTSFCLAGWRTPSWQSASPLQWREDGQWEASSQGDETLSLTVVTKHPYPAATAHFNFCRTLLDHTVSAENIPCPLPRTPGTSLTWHDSRSQRAAGGRPVKLLQQPGTEAPQVPTHQLYPPQHLPCLPPLSTSHPSPHRAGCTLTTMAYTTLVRRWVA